MKKVTIALIAMAVFAFLACSNNDASTVVEAQKEEASTATTSQTTTAGNPIEKEDLKFTLVYETGAGTYASQFIAGFRRQCEALGITPIVSDAAGSQDRMISYIDAAINQRVDAIIISHGRADALRPTIQKALDAGIPVVAKEVDLGMPEVPTVDQDDFMLGLMTVKAMGEDINGQGQVVRAFAAGFLPQERRSLMYQTILTHKYPNIKEVATFGPVSASTALDSQTKMEAILKQFPGEDDLTAVWCGWEEWAKGASRAIMEAGRADEIPVYGMDVSDETLQMLQDPNNPYTASAGVDAAMTAEVCVRMALMKLGGEFVPQYYSFSPAIVKKSDLPSTPVTMADLSEYVPDWGVDNNFWTPWMREMVQN